MSNKYEHVNPALQARGINGLLDETFSIAKQAQADYNLGIKKALKSTTRVWGTMGAYYGSTPYTVIGLNNDFDEIVKIKNQIRFIEYVVKNSNKESRLDLLFEGHILTNISHSLYNIKKSIDRSEKRFLPLFESDWDDNGGKPYLKSTWKKAILLLVDFSEYLLSKGITIGAPVIFHGPEGSVELEWDSKDFSFSINVEETNNQFSYFWSSKNSDNHFGGSHQTEDLDAVMKIFETLF